MARRIAEGEIFVRLSDAEAKAGLKSIEASTRKTMADIDKMSADPSVDLDNAEFRAQAKWVQAEMERLDRERAECVVTANARGFKKVAAEIKALEQLAEHLERGYTLRVDVDRSKLSLATREMSKLGSMTAGLTNHFREVGEAITGAGLRLGPLTLRASAFGGVLGGVVLVAIRAVVGTLVGLTASIGTGLLGVLAGATAGAGAFALGLGGIFAIVKPLTSEMGKAFDAQKKYNKAVETYGKDSKEASKAMEKFKQITGGLGEGTMEAFRAMRSLGKEWLNLTSSARKPFFQTITDGIHTARSLMPLFARESVQSFKVASAAVQDWLAGLRGSEARNIIRNLFGTFQASLPNIAHGLGSLVTMFGRIADAARGMWERFSEGFANVTKDWADFFKPSKARDSLFAQMEESASGLFKLVGATGKLIGAFFFAGASGGDNIVKDITKQFNEWADWLSKPANKKKLNEWIKDAWADAKDFAKALIAVADALKQIADAASDAWDQIRPIIDPLNDISKWLKDHNVGDMQLFPDDWTPDGPAVRGIVDAFNAVKGAASDAAGWIGRQFSRIKLPSLSVPKFSLPGLALKAKDLAFSIIGKVKMPKIPSVKDIFFWVIGLLRMPKIPKIVDKVFDIIGKLHFPKIPNVKDKLFDIIGKLHMPSIPNIPDKVFNIIGKLKKPFGLREGGFVPGFAQGGMPPTDRVKTTRGERVNRAQYFAGEDGAGHPEFIIATNPMFRERNLKLLAMAARVLGVGGAGEQGFRGGGISPGRYTRELEAREQHIGNLENIYSQRERLMLNILDKPVLKEVKQPDGSSLLVRDENNIATMGSYIDDLIKLKDQILKLTRAFVNSINSYSMTMRDALQIHLANEPRKERNKPGKAKGKERNPAWDRWNDKRAEYIASIADLDTKYADNMTRPGDVLLDILDLQKTKRSILDTKSDEPHTDTGGAGAGSGISPEQQAQNDRSARLGLISDTAAAINALTLQTFRGPGDIAQGGTGAYNAALGSGGAVAAMGSSQQAGQSNVGLAFGGGGTTFVINTLHPADPATLSAIGNAATAGMSLQGATSSPRESSGY